MPWSTILSVVVGGVLATIGGVLTLWIQHRREQRALVCAFAGEIGAIVAIIRRRGLLERAEQRAQAAGQGQQPKFRKAAFTQDYFRVYETNAAKIGLLPKGLAGEVARFYTFAASLVDDVAAANAQAGGGEVPPELFAQAVAVLKEMLELGDKIVARLGNA